MANVAWRADSSRRIQKRIIFNTNLVLKSPAHFGNGDSDSATDMPLLTSDIDEKSPLLLGTSLCGALRSYLLAREQGYRSETGNEAGPNSRVEPLFGSENTSSVQFQSRVIVSDSVGKYVAHELRQGVRLNAESRTAEDKALYSYRLWGVGTTFPLAIQLLILEGDDAEALFVALSAALEGLSSGQITLGAKKTRGFGLVGTDEWTIREYDLTKVEGLLDWLSNGVSPPSQKTLKDIGTLTLAGKSFVDHRKELSVELTLSLDASILIRSRAGLNPSDPDIVHIQRPANGGKGSEPIIPGTSWAGVLRARVKKLVSQFHADEQTKKIVTSLFGSDTDERTNQTMSRIFINESVIENCREDLVQQRVAIDPFTGGAKDTALFDENPVYAKPDGRVMLRFRIINPSDLDIGLSLLLTKDLWTGELPVGGESSIGRGRFKGQEASVTVQGETGIHRWSITEKSGHLQITGDQQALEKYVSAVALPTAEV